MVTVSKKILWVSIVLVLVFSTVAILSFNAIPTPESTGTSEYEGREFSIPSGYNDPDELKAVLNHCACQEEDRFCTGEEFRWNNETHNINNITCKWTEKRIPGGLPVGDPVKPFEIILDQNNYPLGNSIKISGKAPGATYDYVILNVLDPNGQLMEAKKITLDKLDRFNTKFDSYSSWEKGQYKIQLLDNNQVKFEKSFTIFTDNFEDDFEETWGGPGNRHPAFLGHYIPDSCTEDMVKHLVQYSNIFESDSEQIMLEWAGLPKGISQEDFDVCWEELLELKGK